MSDEPPPRSSIGVEVSEDKYKIDLEVCDRYQAFSAELLRLALLGTAGIGFLFTDSANVNVSSSGLVLAMTQAFLLLVVAAAAAMGHRYWSSDCLAEQAAYMRHEKRGKSDVADECRENLRWKLRLSLRCLQVAALALILGVIALGIVFLIVGLQPS